MHQRPCRTRIENGSMGLILPRLCRWLVGANDKDKEIPRIMPLLTDPPPTRVETIAQASIALRLRHLNMGRSARVSQPIARRCFAVVKSADTLRFRFRKTRAWDYFVIDGTRIAVATVRESGRKITFEGVTTGHVAELLLHALRVLSKQFKLLREKRYVRILECRAANVISIVLQTPAHAFTHHLCIFDHALLARRAMRLDSDVSKLRTLARARTDSRRKAFIKVSPS